MQSLAVHRSRKLVPEFVLHRPRTLAQACACLSEYRDEAAVIAGGIDVISRMKTGAGPAHVVAIAEIAEMHGVRLVGDCIEIGAAVTHRAAETDDLIRSRLPSVADYVSALGNIRIRCQGTVGGNAEQSGPRGRRPAPAMVPWGLPMLARSAPRCYRPPTRIACATCSRGRSAGRPAMKFVVPRCCIHYRYGPPR